MKFSINPYIERVLFPPIVEIKRQVTGDRTQSGLSYIDLCQAIPDYPPHPSMIHFLQERLSESSAASYTADEGMLEVRAAVCRRYERLYGAKISVDQICLTQGASQAFWLAMITLCQAGDEVIVQVPTYFDYDMALRMLNLSCVYLPFVESNGGLPDVDAIERLITPRTRAILLISPCNPTGMVIPPELIAKLYDLAETRNIALVIDETYADFIAGGKRPHYLFERESWGNNLVHIMSFGKSYAITGYRSGLLAASASFIEQALKCHDTMSICQSTPAQIALGFALDHLDDWVAGNREMMERRNNLFRKEFLAEGNSFMLVASGAFFAWVKHPFAGISAWQIARDMISSAGLVTLPGEIFGPGMSAYLRVAFGNIKEDAIPDAVARFRNLL
ncbi:MAG: aminotransferase [Sulfurimonas sp.]|nr:aminotransferase [Sulfurimonas sp.]